MSRTESLSPIRVNLGTRSYDIRFDSLASLPTLLASLGGSAGLCLIISDENVARLYGDDVIRVLGDGGWTPFPITIPPGESSKSIERLSWIYDTALARGIDRSTPLLAFGGGVVGDLGGFAAATLLRGLPLIQIPTTLIAQVDSAIGGKTGINHAAGKNLLGSFYQARLVLTDPQILQTLPDREWSSGLAEVVKHALIADASFFSYLEVHWNDIIRRDDGVVPPLVHRAAGVKAGVVEKDEREAGLRAILNFGHTFAHSVERVAGYGVFSHGEAVAAGMRAALHLSRSRHPTLDFTRADELVSRIPVPSGLHDLKVRALMDGMQTDKKAKGGRLRFVLLDEIGHAYIADDVEAGLVEAAWNHAIESG